MVRYFVCIRFIFPDMLLRIFNCKENLDGWEVAISRVLYNAFSGWMGVKGGNAISFSRAATAATLFAHLLLATTT